MSLIIIIATIWGISALISHIKQAHLAREQQRQGAEQSRQRREYSEMVAAQIALEREQMKQRREAEHERKERERMEKAQAAAWEKQRKEDERRDAQIAKHEKRIADLEFKAEQASADIEHLRVVLDDLNESFELACQMADKAHAAGDDKREEQAKNKILTLRNKIHSAESRLAKAQHTREMAQRELAA